MYGYCIFISYVAWCICSKKDDCFLSDNSFKQQLKTTNFLGQKRTPVGEAKEAFASSLNTVVQNVILFIFPLLLT